MHTCVLLFLYCKTVLLGVIPHELGNLVALKGMWIHNNNLSGESPQVAARALWRLSRRISHRAKIWMRNLMDEKHETRRKTCVMDLPCSCASLYAVAGTIPHQLGNLTALTILWLQDNQLSGGSSGFWRTNKWCPYPTA